MKRLDLELGLGLCCAGLLLLQVCLTKLFSIVLWYHFGFLAVSTAMLGFAAAGVVLALRGPSEDDEPRRAIARSAVWSAVAVVGSLWLVTQTTFDVYSVIQDRTLGVLLAFVVEVTIPFFFLGLVIARTIGAFPERIGSLYCADLMGSAMGCALAVLLLSFGVPAVHAILVAALLVAAGAVCFAWGRAPGSVLGATVAGLGIAALLALSQPRLAAALGYTGPDPVERVFKLSVPPSKPLHKVTQLHQYLPNAAAAGSFRGAFLPTDPLHWDRGVVTLKDFTTREVETGYAPSADGKGFQVWTDDGPLDLPTDQIAPKDGGGLSFAPLKTAPRGSSLSPLIRFTEWSTLSRVDAFHWPRPLGPWGLWGLSPKYHAEVTEPFPAQKGITIDFWAMTSILRYSGKPIWPPGTPEVDAARAPLRVLEYLPAGTVHRLKPEVGSILCIGAGGGLDLITAKYFGARRITGVEINPSVVKATREVFAEFSGHLYDPDKHPEILVETAEGRHFLERSKERFDVVQLSGVDTFSTTEAGAFTLSENYLYTVEAFRTYAQHLNPGGVITLTRWFIPAFRHEGGKDVLYPRLELRLLALAWEGLRLAGVADPAKAIFYLRCGLFTVILVKPDGFPAEEIQQLAAHCGRYGYDILYGPGLPVAPVVVDGKPYDNGYANYVATADKAAFHRDYPFDVTPPTDDRPFYFEVSRFRSILDEDNYLNSLGGLTAHGILTLLLAEVVLLGLLFIVVPLRRLNRVPGRPQRTSRERLGTLLYFSALGLGFILVEIVLSQKFILFLGHPFYSLAVILFSLLLFSGLGAALSGSMPLPRMAPLLPAVLAVAAGFLLDPLFALFLERELPVRICIAVAALAPIGIVLGMPFPIGIRTLGRNAPDLIPWAWGVNGYTSVLGSVLAVFLGIALGFTVVLWCAAACYLVGVAGLVLIGRPAQPEEPA
jgi:hypothetical protein